MLRRLLLLPVLLLQLLLMLLLLCDHSRRMTCWDRSDSDGCKVADYVIAGRSSSIYHEVCDACRWFLCIIFAVHVASCRCFARMLLYSAKHLVMCSCMTSSDSHRDGAVDDDVITDTLLCHQLRRQHPRRQQQQHHGSTRICNGSKIPITLPTAVHDDNSQFQLRVL